jgi:hypothetical protein
MFGQMARGGTAETNSARLTNPQALRALRLFSELNLWRVSPELGKPWYKSTGQDFLESPSGRSFVGALFKKDRSTKAPKHQGPKEHFALWGKILPPTG